MKNYFSFRMTSLGLDQSYTCAYYKPYWPRHLPEHVVGPEGRLLSDDSKAHRMNQRVQNAVQALDKCDQLHALLQRLRTHVLRQRIQLLGDFVTTIELLRCYMNQEGFRLINELSLEQCQQRAEQECWRLQREAGVASQDEYYSNVKRRARRQTRLLQKERTLSLPKPRQVALYKVPFWTCAHIVQRVGLLSAPARVARAFVNRPKPVIKPPSKQADHISASPIDYDSDVNSVVFADQAVQLSFSSRYQVVKQWLAEHRQVNRCHQRPSFPSDEEEALVLWLASCEHFPRFLELKSMPDASSKTLLKIFRLELLESASYPLEEELE